MKSFKKRVDSKKAQAAMEFLMTYGWAILVVLAAIGGLAYFGVFQHSKILPEQCAMGQPVGCEDFVVQPTQANLVIRNGGSDALQVSQVNVGDCQDNTSFVIAYGRAETITLTGCDFGTSGSAYKGEINIVYTMKNSGLAHTARGMLVAHVQ